MRICFVSQNDYFELKSWSYLLCSSFPARAKSFLLIVPLCLCRIGSVPLWSVVAVTAATAALTVALEKSTTAAAARAAEAGAAAAEALEVEAETAFEVKVEPEAASPPAEATAQAVPLLELSSVTSGSWSP